MNLLKIIVNAIDDVRVKDIKIYDTREVTPLFDYVIIATANSSRQMQAVVNSIEEKEVENDFSIRGIEGVNGGLWTLIDLNDIIVNVFTAEERLNYDLDKLWKNLPQIDCSELLK